MNSSAPAITIPPALASNFILNSSFVYTSPLSEPFISATATLEVSPALSVVFSVTVSLLSSVVAAVLSTVLSAVVSALFALPPQAVTDSADTVKIHIIIILKFFLIFPPEYKK